MNKFATTEAKDKYQVQEERYFGEPTGSNAQSLFALSVLHCVINVELDVFKSCYQIILHLIISPANIDAQSYTTNTHCKNIYMYMVHIQEDHISFAGCDHHSFVWKKWSWKVQTHNTSRALYLHVHVQTSLMAQICLYPTISAFMHKTFFKFELFAQTESKHVF